MEGKKKTLCGGRRGRKLIDMNYVYGQIDKGRTVKAVADEIGVSVSTLHRRHKEYQEEAEAAGKGSDAG